jgi:hypothetical protein
MNDSPRKKLVDYELHRGVEKGVADKHMLATKFRTLQQNAPTGGTLGKKQFNSTIRNGDRVQIQNPLLEPANCSIKQRPSYERSFIKEHFPRSSSCWNQEGMRNPVSLLPNLDKEAPHTQGGSSPLRGGVPGVIIFNNPCFKDNKYDVGSPICNEDELHGSSKCNSSVLSLLDRSAEENESPVLFQLKVPRRDQILLRRSRSDLRHRFQNQATRSPARSRINVIESMMSSPPSPQPSVAWTA